MSTIVLGTLDLGGEGPAVLLAGINAALRLANPAHVDYTLQEFSFGEPAAVTIPSPTKNTVIRLSPLAASGYYGTRKIYYNRIHVTDLGIIGVSRGNATTIGQLLTQINEKYGILILDTDIYDGALPAPLPGETEVEVDLNFRPTSIIYYGGTKIVLGNNDPNQVGGGTQLPFAGRTTVFAYNTTLNGSGIGSLDLTSVTVDADMARKRFASMNTDHEPALLSDIYKRRVEGQMIAGGALQSFPIVDSWRGSDGVFAVDGFGLVYKLKADSTGWDQHGDILGLDLDVPSIALSCLELPRVRFVKQGPANSLWTVAMVGGHAELFKSTDGGVTWDDQAVTGPEHMSLGVVPNGFVLHDVLVHAGKLWTLFTADQTYTDDIGYSDTIALESVDLTTLVMTRHQLRAAVRKNGQGPVVPRNYGSKFTIMTPAQATTPIPTVVGLVSTTWTQAQLYTYVPDAAQPQKFSIYEVRHPAFERDILSRPGTYLQAYGVALLKNEQLAIETIEVGSLVESATFNAEQWIADPVRTAQGYMTFGVKVLTRVASATQANSWVTTSLPMGNGNAAYPLVMVEDGKRMHYALQPESAIYRVRFTEDNTITGFVPALDGGIALEKHAGFARIARHGTTVYSRPGVSETSNTAYGLTTYANTEATKPLIEFSFSGVDSLGVVHWLTSPALATPLAHRSVGIDYAGMSETPLAVATQGTSLLYWSATNGIYSSPDAGHSWARYSDARVGYNAADGLDTDLIGYADVAFRPQDFRQGSFINNQSTYELAVSRNVLVYDRGSSQLAAARTLTNRVLFQTDAVGGQSANSGYENAGPAGGFGVNLLDGYSPKRVLHWETDGIVTSTVADYTTDPDQPLMVPQDDGLLLGVEVELALDIKRDVKFLDIDSLVWGTVEVSGSTIHMLEWIKAGAVVGSLELFGGSNAPTAGFTPEVAHFLWQYQETNYVPLVYYGNKKVLLVGRLDTAGEFACTLHNLALTGDNGAPVVPVPMLSKNRRDYLYAQKGNGIFRLVYNYDTLNKTAALSFERIFQLSASEFSDISVVTGTQLSATVAVPPTVPLIPTNPVAGTELSVFCDGVNQMANIADGNGGYTVQLKEADSVDCGYTAPAPTPVGANSATITLNTDTSNTSITNTDVISDEGENVYAVYALDTALNADAMVDFGFGGSTANAADIVAFGVRVGTSGGWTTVTMPHTLTIPAGATVFAVRAQLRMDATTEGEEKFTISVKKNVASNAQILNGTINTEFTINDTSITPPPPSSLGQLYFDNYPSDNKGFAASGDINDYYDALPADAVTDVTYDRYGAAALVITQAQELDLHVPRTVPTQLFLDPPVYAANTRTMINMRLPEYAVQDGGGVRSLITHGSAMPGGSTYADAAVSFLFYTADTAARNVEMQVWLTSNGTEDQYIIAGTTPATRPFVREDNGVANHTVIGMPRSGTITFEIELVDFNDGKKLTLFTNGSQIFTQLVDHWPAGTEVAMGVSLASVAPAVTNLKQWEITGIEAPITNSTLSLDLSGTPNPTGQVTSVNPVTEGDWITLVYKLADSVAAPIDNTIWLEHVTTNAGSGGTDSPDIVEAERWNVGTGQWEPYGMTGWIQIPEFEAYVALRVKLAADGTTEGDETLTFRMNIENSTGFITNPTFENTFTLQDAP